MRLLTLLRPLRGRPVAVAAVLLALAVSGCGTDNIFTHAPQTRGNKVDLDVLAQLVPGTSSRADASALLGSPTAHATFDDNTWIYIGEVTRPVVGGTLKVQDQEVVVLTFDQGGTLRNVEKRAQEDSAQVAVVSRTTPSPGNDASLLQQLLGNVGRFSPASADSPNSVGGAGSANKF